MATAGPRLELQEIADLHRNLTERQRATVERAKALVARTRETLERIEAERAGRAGPASRAKLQEEVDGLRLAMEHRAVIEQAKGIIIGTSGCSPDEAFDLLRQQSQHMNRKIRDIAAEIVAAACRASIAS
jgi:AmiR/NasT family two-component response regulator